MPSTRKLRVRASVATAPVSVSQLTVEALVGIDPRRYLELLADHPDVPRACVGKLRVVALDDLRGLLARLSTTSSGEREEHAPRADEPTTADDVLSRLGLRRSA